MSTRGKRSDSYIEARMIPLILFMTVFALAIFAVSGGAAPSLPPPSTSTVTVNSNGLVVSPSNFPAANNLLTTNAVGVSVQPYSANTTTLGNATNEASGIAVADSQNALQGSVFKIPAATVICGIGDSIMAGYSPPLASDSSQSFLNRLSLQPSLAGHVTIHNFGVGGTVSAAGAGSGGSYATNCHSIFVGTTGYKILVVIYGSNDANGGVAISDYDSNMLDIISRAEADSVDQIIVGTVLPRGVPSGYTLTPAPQYNTFLKSLPQMFSNVKVLDLAARFPNQTDAAFYSSVTVNSVNTSTGVLTVTQSGGTRGVGLGDTLILDAAMGKYCDPLFPGTIYYAIPIDLTHLKLATSSANATAGTAITLTSTQAGFSMIVDYTHLNAYANAIASQELAKVIMGSSDAQGAMNPADQAGPNLFNGLQTFAANIDNRSLYGNNTKLIVSGRLLVPSDGDLFIRGNTLELASPVTTDDLWLYFDQNGPTKIWGLVNRAYVGGAAKLELVDIFNSSTVVASWSEGAGEALTLSTPVSVKSLTVGSTGSTFSNLQLTSITLAAAPYVLSDPTVTSSTHFIPVSESSGVTGTIRVTITPGTGATFTSNNGADAGAVELLRMN